MPDEVGRLTVPSDLQQAEALLRADSSARPLGGGTTVVPAITLADGMSPTARAHWVAVGHLPELRTPPTIARGRMLIGAGRTLASIESHALVRVHLPLLAAAVAATANPGVRSVATLGGAVASGGLSPDPGTALAALGARLHVRRSGSPIRVALEQRRPDDLIVAVSIPVRSSAWAHERLTVRGREDRPVVTVAVVGGPARMVAAVGAVALDGIRRISIDPAADTAAVLGAAIRDWPVADDERASAAYRRSVAVTLVQRALARAAGAESGRTPSVAGPAS